MRQLSNIMTFYAVSPIHAGAESSTGVIDNPIQREVHTNYPVIHANGVKGAMRSHFRKMNNDDTINFIFGSDIGKHGNDDKAKNAFDENNEKISMAGVISVSDAKLFAMPVRSNIAPFVMVTCPSILKRLKTDLELTNIEGLNEITTIEKDSSISINWEPEQDQIILEDAVVKKGVKAEVDEIKKYFPKAEKLLLISDEMFKYVSENCTEVQTQIKIDEKTGTAQDGNLRYEELLPSDSILYSVTSFDKSHFDNELQAETIKKKIEDSFSSFMQIGGDATLGRGIVKTDWLKKGE